MIRTVLVANRGEIARRVFRTCRDMGIRTVAVFSDADADAPYVREADQAVRIGPPEPSLSYLDIETIIEAARRTGADAIHPGYGFLAENPAFAEACAAAGITFIGPSPHAMAVMGSKLESKRVMVDAGVPTLPSVEITDDTDVGAEAGRIGYPVLVKASAGGGGKGMRIVPSADDLEAAVEGAIREAESAFGDGTVFLEKYLEGPRHIEIQVFGDTHGTIVSLFERECSIQRRHQKIVEEAPSTAVSAELRARMGEAAVSAARAVDYVGAGTVEFLLDTDDTFYFLEMNTRLQVEHPVTEEITGLDLVRLQIDVAAGAPLPDRAVGASISGHAIEVRLYAEDPANDYLPVTGTVQRFRLDGVRVDTGVEDGSEVSIYYDPMIAKVISHGATRDDAIRILASALRRGVVFGLTTNLTLLINILESDDFATGATDTGFLERHDPVAMSAPLGGDRVAGVHALAAALADQAARRRAASVLATLPSGWRNNTSQLNPAIYRIGDREVRIGYQIVGSEVTAEIDGERSVGTLHRADPHLVDLDFGGVRRDHHIDRSGSSVSVVSAAGTTHLTEVPLLPVPEIERDPGSLLAPMPGKVISILATPGDAVDAGQTLLVLEAMKMEHRIDAPVTGTVAAIPVTEGDQVEADQVLAVVDDGSHDD